MTIRRNTTHLCGHFITSDWSKTAGALTRQEWTLVTNDNLDNTKNYYYSDFVDFAKGGNPTAVQKKTADYILSYTKSVDRAVDVVTRSRSVVPVLVQSLYVHIAPFGIVLFNIDIVFENAEYNDIASVLQILRDNCHYDDKVLNDFIHTAISPVYDIYLASTGNNESKNGNYQALAKNGNKLKLFQIVESEDIMQGNTAAVDRRLYYTGCLMPQSDDGTADDSYYRGVMDAGRIAVFDDWRALALFDSFTMITLPLPDWKRDIWNNDYFSMIYLYALYRQAFLFHYDALFHAPHCNIKQLEADILLFERRYTFFRFSYNFLPHEIGRAMERALELHDNSDNLHAMVTQAGELYEKESNDKMNRMLTLLAAITICSTIWDLFSMINEAWAFPNQMSLFRTGMSVLMLVLLCIGIVFLRSRKGK